MNKPIIGFIGLGIMGKPMVKRLVEAGFIVHAYSILESDIKAVEEFGVKAEQSGLDVTKKAEITITMVPNTPQVEDIVFGDNGICNALCKGKIWIDMSTISSLATQDFAKRVKDQTGADVLDAPVSGGDKGAKTGTLSIMVGGDEKIFIKCLPVLQAMGSRITHVGNNGAGQIVKSCNQVLAASTMAALGEALVMGTKAGVDPTKILEVLGAGYARCGCIDIRGNFILERNFEPGFMTKLQYKDLSLAMELSRGIDVPMPIGSMVHEFYKSCIAQGLGNEDHSNVIKIFEHMADVEVKAGGQKK